MRSTTFLRGEALVLGLEAAGAYVAIGYGLLMFVVLGLLPDISIAAYLAGRGAGSPG